MDDTQKRIDEKLDKISDDITDIKVTMARNTVSLEEHIKRTNLLEESQKELRQDLKPIKTTFRWFKARSNFCWLCL